MPIPQIFQTVTDAMQPLRKDANGSTEDIVSQLEHKLLLLPDLLPCFDQSNRVRRLIPQPENVPVRLYRLEAARRARCQDLSDSAQRMSKESG
eukprot:2542835-Rhodomonas_salina.2